MNPLDISLAAAYFGRNAPKQKFTYHASGQVEYHGIAPRGTGTDEPAWFITRSTFDSNNRVTDIDVSPSGSIWDNRTTLDYE